MTAERGFTLLELLVVLAVLMLVSGLAATAFGGNGAPRHHKELVVVGRYLEQVRERAVASGTMVKARIGSAAGVAPDSIASMSLAWKPQAAHDAGGGPVFYPDGTATAGVVELDASGRRYSIVIHWTGEFRGIPGNE